MALNSLRTDIVKGGDPATLQEFHELRDKMGEKYALELLKNRAGGK